MALPSSFSLRTWSSLMISKVSFATLECCQKLSAAQLCYDVVTMKADNASLIETSLTKSTVA